MIRVVTDAGNKAVTIGSRAVGGTVYLAGQMAEIGRNLDFSTLDPTKYIQAGMRGEYRTIAEATKVWEAIPETIRAAGPDATMDFLLGKDWSHIVPYSQGGSENAANGIWEHYALNRSRGAEVMTPQELAAAQSALQSGAVQAALTEAAKASMNGALISAAVVAVLSVLEYGLAYQRGEISEESMYRKTGEAIAKAGIAGAAVTGLVVFVALTFPPFAAFLTFIAPVLMVLGFAALGYKLVTVGKGWYGVWVNEQPLKPLALHYWLALAEMKNGAVDGVQDIGKGAASITKGVVDGAVSMTKKAVGSARDMVGSHAQEKHAIPLLTSPVSIQENNQ